VLPGFCTRPAFFCRRNEVKAAKNVTRPQGDFQMKQADKSGTIIWDDKIPGLGLRKYAGGSATWIFRYRIGGLQRNMKLGNASALNVKNARESARPLYAAVMLGKDPAGERAEARAKVVESFGSILVLYLARKRAELKPRSFEELQRHLEKHAAPLHKADLATIERRTIAGLLTNLAASSGPTLANSVRSSLSSFFGWAMREGLADVNPIIATNKAVVLASRDRVLSDAELKQIWAALGDDPYSDILRLLSLTACRRDEIGSLRWSEVDLDKAQIVLPGSRTKNSREHIVGLSNPALEILKARPHLSDFVFTTGRGGFKGWSNLKPALDRRIAAKSAIADWRLHDLRRTAATGMANIGVLPPVVEAVLNHVSGSKAGVAGIYNRSTCEAEKRRALDLWGEHLLAVVEGRKSKVVPFKAS
jgi:integrase